MSDELHKLSEYLVRSFDTLEYAGATHCRCGSCWSFQTIDQDKKVTHEADSLAELVAALPNPTE